MSAVHQTMSSGTDEGSTTSDKLGQLDVPAGVVRALNGDVGRVHVFPVFKYLSDLTISQNPNILFKVIHDCMPNADTEEKKRYTTYTTKRLKRS
jgi:hypothetical protein